MGRELWYVAVVDGDPVLTRSLADPAFGDHLEPFYFGPERWRHHRDDLDAEFFAAVDAMNRAHPGIEKRILTLDRVFDMLHYLISEPRRRGEFDETDDGTRAILGQMPLADHLRGGQGHPIRYNPPAEVQAIARHLAKLVVADLRSVYDPAAMEQQAVYKIGPNRDDAGTCDRIIGHFEGLRAFYAEVARHGEGVLVIVT